jgi:hypothetical protein
MPHAFLVARDSIQTNQEVHHALAVGLEPMQTRKGQHTAQHAALEIFQIQTRQQAIFCALNAMLDHTLKSLQVQVALCAQVENFQAREGHQYAWTVQMANILELGPQHASTVQQANITLALEPLNAWIVQQESLLLQLGALLNQLASSVQKAHTLQ